MGWMGVKEKSNFRRFRFAFVELKEIFNEKNGEIFTAWKLVSSAVFQLFFKEDESFCELQFEEFLRGFILKFRFQ
jgi:hypothetical protein